MHFAKFGTLPLSLSSDKKMEPKERESAIESFIKMERGSMLKETDMMA